MLVPKQEDEEDEVLDAMLEELDEEVEVTETPVVEDEETPEE